MRSKEEAHDYRYFPDPDLPALVVDDALLAAARDGMPELPHVRRDRYRDDLGLPEGDAHRLSIDDELGAYFDTVARESGAPRGAANWVLTELLGRLNAEGRTIADCPVPPVHLAGLVRLQNEGSITGKVAKDVFDETWRTGADPARIVATRGLAQVSDAAALEPVCREVLAAHPGQAAQYRGGKTAVLGFFVGQVMRATRGTGNPELVQRILRELLGEPDGP